MPSLRDAAQVQRVRRSVCQPQMPMLSSRRQRHARRQCCRVSPASATPRYTAFVFAAAAPAGVS